MPPGSNQGLEIQAPRLYNDVVQYRREAPWIDPPEMSPTNLLESLLRNSLPAAAAPNRDAPHSVTPAPHLLSNRQGRFAGLDSPGAAVQNGWAPLGRTTDAPPNVIRRLLNEGGPGCPQEFGEAAKWFHANVGRRGTHPLPSVQTSASFYENRARA